MEVNQTKYAFFLLVSIVGNPFYQMAAYLICSELDLGASQGTNVYQADPWAFILILVLIYLVRLLIYSFIFTSNEYPFSVKGTKSFLYIFSERHMFQAIGLLSLFVWLSPLEGNIIGFIVFPLTVLLGLAVSIITFVRLLKTRKIMAENNK